jgi:hypothetical protein
MQGGDLIMWDKAKVGHYVGVDIAEGSVSSIPHQSFMLCVCASNMCGCTFCISRFTVVGI